jgi:hypothetical protein
MTSVQPISGNQNFTKVENTAVSVSAVTAALAAGSSEALLVLEGTAAVPASSTGNVAVVNDEGVTVNVPDGAVALRVLMEGDGVLTADSGTTLQVGASDTDGGAVDSELTVTSGLTAAAVGGLCPAVTQVVPVPSSDSFLSVTVGAAGPTAGGNLKVKVLYTRM